MLRYNNRLAFAEEVGIAFGGDSASCTCGNSHNSGYVSANVSLFFRTETLALILWLVLLVLVGVCLVSQQTLFAS